MRTVSYKVSENVQASSPSCSSSSCPTSPDGDTPSPVSSDEFSAQSVFACRSKRPKLSLKTFVNGVRSFIETPSPSNSPISVKNEQQMHFPTSVSTPSLSEKNVQIRPSFTLQSLPKLKKCQNEENEGCYKTFPSNSSEPGEANRPSEKMSSNESICCEKRESKDLMELRKAHSLQELIYTEREYIKYLSLITDGYIKFMKDPTSQCSMPEDLKGGKDEIIFANIDSIYKWHRDVFVKALESCLENKQDFGSVFKKHENKLLMYVNYCQKKPLSEYIVSEHTAYFETIRIALNHKLQLGDLLIKPVQRITKYHLMLSEIYKYTIAEDERASLKEAQKIMQKILDTTNILMKFGCLENFEGEIYLQGKLLQHGILRCSENNPCLQNGNTSGKIKEYAALLFEQSIIFSEQYGKDINPDYIFRYQFMLNKTELKDTIRNDDGNGWFVLTSTDCKTLPPLTLHCCTTEPEERKRWVDNIRNILCDNYRIIQALTDPLGNAKSLNSKSVIASKNSNDNDSDSNIIIINNNNNNNNDNDNKAEVDKTGTNSSNMCNTNVGNYDTFANDADISDSTIIESNCSKITNTNTNSILDATIDTNTTTDNIATDNVEIQKISTILETTL